MKYFCISDVHGFYEELKQALKEKGFNEKNPEHKLVLIGDAFDRGKEAKKLLNYLYKLKKNDKLIYLQGNHESLIYDCLFQLKEHVNISECHWSNKTIDTIEQLTGINKFDLVCGVYNYDKDIYPKMKKYFELTKDLPYYYELNDYILTHGFIPLSIDKDTGKYEYNYNWKNASVTDWEKALWLCGYDYKDLNKTGKKLVTGHWHCSYAWSRIKNISQFDADAIWDIYEDDKIVCIDRCTAFTNKVNVYVIEQN